MMPNHPITVTVIGCGGTGSYVVTQLAKIAVALKALRDIQMRVIVCDDDKVEAHNVGRQLFSESDIGQYKSNVIVSRVNRFYGFNWKSGTERMNYVPPCNIVITCVDNVKTRRMIRDLKYKKHNKNCENYQRYMYWMDFGNSKDYGQYILSTFGSINQPDCNTPGDSHHYTLPNVFDLYGRMKEVPNEPSCSMAESLSEQDLFINLQLASAGINLLWKLLKEHQISYHGQFINSGTGDFRPIKI